MKISLTAVLFILVLGLKSQIITNAATGPHGGAVNYSQGYKIELVNSYGSIITYLFYKDMPIPNKNLKGEVLFMFADDVSLNKKLIPYENDGLMTEISNPYYLYCILTFNISDKMITTKFLNQTGVAENKKQNQKK